MAKELDVDFKAPMLADLAKELRAKLGSGQQADNIFTRHMVAAIKAAMKPGVQLLKNETPRGPTGNLKRSVKQVAKMYRKDRVWFGAVGYSADGKAKTKINKSGRRTGSDLGYHQGLVEAGTGRRVLGKHTGQNPTRIASSISGVSSLSIKNTKGGMLRTSPKPNKGFFTRAKAGSTVVLAPMKGEGNIPKVASMADDFMESALRRDMVDRVEKAWKNLDYLNNRHNK